MNRILAAFSVLLVVSIAVWSYLDEGIVHLLLDPRISSEVRYMRLQTYFTAWGAAGPIVYMFVVTLEVILAPIPGTILYLPGGVIFGGFVGGTMSLAGNVVGAGIACQITRTFGSAYIERLLERHALKRYEVLIEQRGLWLIFLLRVNPLTSSDLVSYAAGLTRIPVWKVMTGTLLGMAPICYAQAYFAQAILAIFPWLIYPLIVIGILYALYVVRFLKKGAQPPNESVVDGSTKA